MSKAAFRPTLDALLLVVLTATAYAGEVTRLGPLEIDTPWARATIGTTRPGAAYATFRNTGDRPEKLVDISTPAAAHPEVHEMTQEGGVMKMRSAGPLEIPPGEEVHLEPGGMHIMLMQLRQPLEEGASIPITFIFEEAGEITVSAPSRALRPEPRRSEDAT
jgi:periplasmic copper chaperone A